LLLSPVDLESAQCMREVWNSTAVEICRSRSGLNNTLKRNSAKPARVRAIAPANRGAAMAARVGLLSLHGPQDEAADCARARAMKVLPQAALRVTQRLYVHVPGAALLATPDAACMQMLATVYDSIASQAPLLDLVPLLPSAGWTLTTAAQISDVEVLFTAPGTESHMSVANAARVEGGQQKLPVVFLEEQDSESKVYPSTGGDAPPELPAFCFKHAAVGGTFDRLHSGHRNLLAAAAVICDGTLYVGIAGDKLLASKKNAHLIQPYEERAEIVVRFLKAVRPDLEVKAGALLNPADPPLASTMKEMEGLIISREVVAGANAIQEYRKSQGFDALTLVVVDLIGATSQAPDAAKLSSTKLRQEEADGAGH